MSIDLSLDRLGVLINHLPPYTRPTCHIAGTNGKGSVSALVSTILQSSSLKVGRYNSPHLVSIYDCITINNIPISPDSYDAARLEVTEKDQEKVDVAVVEVGMGGRLDATNIIPDGSILVSALTAVDLDHQLFLGDTVGKIAFEKAGIARKGRPFVVGSQNPGHAEEMLASVKKVVDDVGAVLVPAIRVLERDWDTTVDNGPKPESFSLLGSSSQIPPPQPIQTSLPCFSSPLPALPPLYGAHQLDNLGTALTVINTLLTDPSCQETFNRNSSTPVSLKDIITPQSVARGIKETKWAGRLSFHTVNLPPSHTPNEAPPPPFLVLADGAHNPASAETLGLYITHLISQTFTSNLIHKKLNLNITYILSLSHSPPKTPLQTLSPLFPLRIPTVGKSSDITVSKTISVVLPRFTPPEGMPWVKCTPPTEMEAVIKELIPEAEVWVVPDAAEGNEQGALEKSLRWAARKRQETEKEGVEQANLVVLAGSLYLVADFYRFLDGLV